MNRRATQFRRGFWIVESAAAIAVIGIGVVALVGSQQAWHIQTVASDELATGMRLATEIREMSLLLPSMILLQAALLGALKLVKLFRKISMT